MRILYTMYQGNPYSGGQGVYLYHVANEMVRRGHEVHIIAGSPWPRCPAGATLHKIDSYSFWAHFDDRQAFFGRPLRSFVNPLNFWEFVGTRHSLSQLLLMFSLRAYRRMKELGPFDVIHDNQTLAYGDLLMQQHAPRVATIHHPISIDRDNTIFQAGSLLERLQRQLWFPWVMQERVARRADAVVTVSETSAASIRGAFRVPEERLHVVHNGVEVDTFRPLGLPREEGHIVHLANTEDANKGVRFLIAALARLRDEGEEFRLTIVDKEAEDLNVAPGAIEENRLWDRVTFTGRLDDGALVELLNRTSFAVCASVYEGFGLPACEAAACGTPLLSTTGGALGEILEPDVTAHLVPPGDVDAMAAGLRRMLHDRDLRERLSCTSRQSIASRFTWERASDSLETIYEQVVAERSGIAQTVVPIPAR